MSFTPKSEDQLAWELVKAAVRAQVSIEVFDYRNRRMNEILSDIWPAFEASLSGEARLEIDPEYEKWIEDAQKAIAQFSEA